jgi:carboxyl-terminal processing protease
MMALAAGGLLQTGCLPGPRGDNLAVFDATWRTVDEWYFDPAMNGLDWAAIRRDWRPRAARAETQAALYLDVLVPILDQFDTSHVDIRPPGALMLSSDRLYRMPRQRPGPSITLSRSDEAGMGAKLTWAEPTFMVEDVTFPGPAYDVGLRPGQRVSLGHWRRLDKHSHEIELIETPSNRVMTIRWTPKPPPPKTERRTLDDGTDYLRFDAFDQGSMDWVTTNIQQAPPSGLILDLRDNTGGAIAEVGRLLSILLPVGSDIGVFKTRQGVHRGKTLPSPATFAGPLAVLIGPRTASGGEVTAAALQHGRRARLFGARTAGAVLGSRIFALPDQGKLTVPFADYLSPAGLRIEGNGLSPDVAIVRTPQSALKGIDPALLAASQWLGQQKRPRRFRRGLIVRY